MAANLLSLALAAARPAWSAGQAVWLWGDKRRGAFLKNFGDGFVHLCLTGVPRSCPIYILDSATFSWRTCNNLRAEYDSWVKAVKPVRSVAGPA